MTDEQFTEIDKQLASFGWLYTTLFAAASAGMFTLPYFGQRVDPEVLDENTVRSSEGVSAAHFRQAARPRIPSEREASTMHTLAPCQKAIQSLHRRRQTQRIPSPQAVQQLMF
jgi:hypothetical protein